MKWLTHWPVSRWLIVTLIVSTGLVIWGYRQNELASQREHSTHVDFYMIHIVQQQFTSTGQLKYQLTTPKVVHFTNTDYSRLTQPRLLLHNSQGQPWKVQADIAITHPKTHSVLLKNHVLIRQIDPTTKTALLILQTPELHVHQDTSIATTDQPITIIRNRMTIHGIGAIINLEQGNLTLLSRMRGTLTPAPQHSGIMDDSE